MLHLTVQDAWMQIQKIFKRFSSEYLKPSNTYKVDTKVLTISYYLCTNVIGTFSKL